MNVATVAPREITTKSGVTFVTVLTDQDAVMLCGDGDAFARSLKAKAMAYKGGLTHEQMKWAHKKAMDVLFGKPEPIKQALDDVAGIFALFQTAKASKLKFPKITLEAASGQPICLKLASGGQYKGDIHVTDGLPFGQNKYFGRIAQDGGFVRGGKCTDEIAAFLQEFAKDPAGVAAKYGHLTGHCCFCQRHLTDENSVAVGYGPVCADHYGLPWGKPSAPGYDEYLEHMEAES